MRTPLLTALLLAPLAGCGSSGGSAAPSAPSVDVTVTVADVATPHGYWIVRALNTWSGSHERVMVLSFLHDGEQQAISAVPDAGYHVVWSGTDDDTSTALTNTFHAASGKTVTVGFAL